MKGLQDININIIAGTTVENKSKLILYGSGPLGISAQDGSIRKEERMGVEKRGRVETKYWKKNSGVVGLVEEDP